MIFACFALLFLQYESLLSSLKTFSSSFTFICLVTHLLFIWLPDFDHTASGNRTPLRSSSFDSEPQQTQSRNQVYQKGYREYSRLRSINQKQREKFFLVLLCWKSSSVNALAQSVSPCGTVCSDEPKWLVGTDIGWRQSIEAEKQRLHIFFTLVLAHLKSIRRLFLFKFVSLFPANGHRFDINLSQN